ncbi:Ert1 protein [Maudiozyma humilis]|uniref:Ert1 protein n=1 Tax=Maudiozyma humilis TaxID=51915 RepID=A0AAV5S2U6_MAUHU|nr:Ert1 protein [Kazachstania humilis]
MTQNNDHISMSADPVGKAQRRRRHTSVACVNCSRWHVSCDAARPCQRCVVKGMAETCVDAPRKKSKYLQGVPDNALPSLLRERDTGREQRRSSSVRSGSTSSLPSGGAPSMRFLSDAANSEYSMLSALTQPGPGTGPGRPPQGFDLPRRLSPGSASQRGSSTSLDSSVQLNAAQGRNAYTMLLGPHSREIVGSQLDLMTNHFPLVPVDTGGDPSLDFKRLVAEDPALKGRDMQKNARINQYYLNSKTRTFPEVSGELQSQQEDDNKLVSFALECTSADSVEIHANADWPHSLRYATPMEIYTHITAPFAHTAGFHHLLLYLKGRFPQRDVVEMCRSLAEFRPIFIACSVTLTEEDMIFMEQVYQRTLLEYARFIALSGTPTCVWRRNGQISYVNEEFEVLSGWKREELLGKMTFVVEILDDESVREYFRTFSSVAYKDFRGSERMRVCRVRSPVKGLVVECGCQWTLKRDISGLPLMIIGNFMPVCGV